MKTVKLSTVIAFLLGLALVIGSAGCAGHTLKQDAYTTRLTYNASVRLIIAARQLHKIDDPTYVEIDRACDIAEETLAEIDSRVARIDQINEDATLTPDQKTAAVKQETDAFNAANAVLARILPRLAQWADESLPAHPTTKPAK